MSSAFLTAVPTVNAAAENKFAQAMRIFAMKHTSSDAPSTNLASVLKSSLHKKTRQELRREEAVLAARARERRRQERIEAKIMYADLEDSYAGTPIQPGFLFWKSLLLNADYPVNRLRMRIPDSLLVLDKLYWARTLASGFVQCEDEFSIIDVYQSFKPKSEARCAVMRVPESRSTETKAVVLTWQEFGDKVLKSQLPRSGVLQKFIAGRSGSHPTTTRLFYISQSKLNKASHGFAISNPETTGNLVCMASGLNAVPLCSAALEHVAELGRLVVEYLQLAHKVRIEEIVLDFIRDESDNYWLIGCKGFRLDMVAQRTRELRAAEEQGKTLAEVKELRSQQLEKQLSAMQCKMCLLPYRPDELRHVLPFKLLLIYKERANNPVLDLSHLRVSSLDFLSYCVRLCDICYLLVLQENELLHTQISLASALHVQMQPPRLLGTTDFQHPTFLPSTLQQWRVLFYFKALSQIAEKAYLQYRFLGREMCLPVEGRILNQACLHYVFAVEGALAENCRSHHVQFRITRGQSPGAVMWVGECRPLASFTATDSVALIQPYTILFFAEDCVQATLTMCIGLVLDKTVQSKEVLASIERMGSLYVPEPGYFSSDPLPAAWMEAFECEYQGIEPSVILDSSEELHAMYSPTLTEKTVLAAPPVSSKVLHMNVDLNPRSSPRKTPLPCKRSLHTPLLLVPQLPPINSVISKLFSRPSSRQTCRTPLSTTASSSRVLYQCDSNKTKSPTFVSARHRGTPSFTAMPQEEGFEMNTEELKSVVQRYMRQKCQSLNLPPSRATTLSEKSELSRRKVTVQE